MKKIFLKTTPFIALILVSTLVLAMIKATKKTGNTASKNTDVLKALFKGSPKPIPLYGFNGNNIKSPAWSNKAFRDSAASLKFDIFRYPGGSLGEYWDWRKGWFIDDNDQLKSSGLNLPDAFKNIPYSPSGLKELKLLVGEAHSDVVFDLNMVTKNLDDQLEMLKTAQSMGIAIKWVELGNEYNLPKSPGRIKYTSPKSYGEECQKWAAAIKRDFPGVKVAVIGGNRAYDSDVRDWNNTVLNQAPNVDAIVAHLYPLPANVVDGSGINFENLFNAFKEDFDKQGFDNVNKNIWITEANIHWAYSKPGIDAKAMQQYADSWGQALAAILMASEGTNMPSSGPPEMFINHGIANWRGFAAIEMNKGAVHVLPNGIGFGTWCEACRNKSSMKQISFQEKADKYSKNYDVLGWQFIGGNEETNLIVNFTSDPIKIDVTALSGNGKTYYHLKYADKNKLINNWGDVTHETKEIKNNEIELPPYSIGTL